MPCRPDRTGETTCCVATVPFWLSRINKTEGFFNYRDLFDLLKRASMAEELGLSAPNQGPLILDFLTSGFKSLLVFSLIRPTLQDVHGGTFLLTCCFHTEKNCA